MGEKKPNSSFFSSLDDAIADAQLMLTAFQRAGADRFDLALTDIEGESVQAKRHITADSLRKKLPSLLARADEESLNVIIRPRPQDVTIIQLDDINVVALAL